MKRDDRKEAWPSAMPPAELVKQVGAAEGTMSSHVEHRTVPNTGPAETDDEGDIRGFTLATTTLGTEVEPDVPYGSFMLHNNTKHPF